MDNINIARNSFELMLYLIQR